jgi:mono/diheme cytochrome c family protein
MAFLFRQSPLLLGAFLVASTGLRAAEVPNYETQIRPILKEHCTHCHGEEEKLKGGVDLRLRRFMDGKTEDGDAILTPGYPEKSALWTLARDGEMPKKGKKMPEHQLALLAAWIKAGAKISETEPTGVIPPGVYVSASDRKFWSFQPVTKPTIPRFADTPELSPIETDKLIDDMRLLSHARSRDLKSDDNLHTLPIQSLLRSDQTRDRRPRQILLGEPSGRRRDSAAGAEDDLRRTALVRG